MATMKTLYITISEAKMKCLEKAMGHVKFQGFIHNDTNRAWRADGKREIKTNWNDQRQCLNSVLIEPVGPSPRRRYTLSNE